MKVTRIAYSLDLNARKYAQLTEQVRRLGQVRSLVWSRYGSITGASLSDREVRQRWMDDPYLSRKMRKQWARGHNRTHNQIIIRSGNVRAFTLTEGGDVWLSVPGLAPRTSVPVPLNTTVAPSGTLRLILRSGRVEVHYQIDADDICSSSRPCGDRTVGVDKGYTEVLTDSDGDHHGDTLGVRPHRAPQPGHPQAGTPGPRCPPMLPTRHKSIIGPGSSGSGKAIGFTAPAGTCCTLT